MGLFNARELTLLENRFDWNAAFGFSVAGMGPSTDSNIALVRNAAHDNGVAGEYFAGARNFTVTGEEFSRNNWRGRRAGVTGHSTTGAKYSGLTEGIIRNIVANDNHGNGLWFDFWNQAVTVLDSTMSFNNDAGLYFEGNDAWPIPAVDPTSFVVRATIEGNGVGVSGISSRDVRIDSSVLIGNEVALSLNGTPRVNPNNIPTMYLRDWYVTNNDVVATCPQHLWLHYGDEVPTSAPNYFADWQPVMQSLLSNDNDYSHPLGAEVEGFLIKTEPASLPTWQTCTLASQPWCYQAQDANSTFVP